MPLALEWIPGRFAICRLDADAVVPSWAAIEAAGFRRAEPPGRGAVAVAGPVPRAGPGPGALLCIARTKSELSIVIDTRHLPPGSPAGMRAERGFVALAIVGVVEMSLVGILARLTGALAAAEVPVFVISTYDTDIMMVREQFAAKAVEALASVADVSRLGAAPP